MYFAVWATDNAGMLDTRQRVREGVYKSVEVRPWAWGLGQPMEGESP